MTEEQRKNLLCASSEDTAISELSHPKNIIFTDEKGTEVGRIDWSDGAVKFTGNVEESARIFFECLLKQYILSLEPSKCQPVEGENKCQG